MERIDQRALAITISMEDQDATKVTKLCYSCSVIISLSVEE